MVSNKITVGRSNPIITGHPDGIMASIDLYLGRYTSNIRLAIKIAAMSTLNPVLYGIAKAGSLYDVIDKYVDPLDYELDQANLEIRALLLREAKRGHKFRNRTGNLERSITEFALSNKTVNIEINLNKAPYGNKVLNRDPFLDKALEKIQPQIADIYLKHINKAIEIEMTQDPLKEICNYQIHGLLLGSLIGGGLKVTGIR